MLIPLETRPLNARYDNSNFFLYHNDEAVAKPQVRRMGDLREVAYDRTLLERTEASKAAYYMYRDLCRAEDRHLFESRKIRYDVTIMPPANIGEEYVKTSGHYHPAVKDAITYPEIYEVLSGEAHYLLQRLEKGEIADVAVIKAEKDDKVLIPPNHGHTTINPSGETLVMANLVSSQFVSIYDPVKKMGGAAYFELIGNRFVKNLRYGNLPELRAMTAPSLTRFPRGENLYALFLKNAADFEFLNEPWKHQSLLPV